MTYLSNLSVSVLAFVFAGTVDAWAEDWLVVRDEAAAYGFDRDSLKPDASTGVITSIYATYTSSGAKLDNLTYHYGMMEAVIDCSGRRLHTNSFAVFDRDGKILKTVLLDDNTTWKSADESQGVGKLVFRMACEGKAPPKNVIPAGDMTGAFAKMRGG